jgi:putative ABC transport system permease protein
MKQAEEQVVEVLRRHRKLSAGDEENFAINRQAEIVDFFNNQTRVLFGVATFIGIITLVVGAIGVMNIMLVAVTERTREIGVRRAIGARKWQILLQFLSEAIFVTMIGGAVGTAIGMGGAWLLAQITDVASGVSAQSGLLGILVSGVTGLVAGIWPAWRASRLDPIESLRYE